MKIGDQVRATVRNNAQNAPDGLVMEGELVSLDNNLATLSTQFGIRVTLSADSVQPVNNAGPEPQP